MRSENDINDSSGFKGVSSNLALRKDFIDNLTKLGNNNTKLSAYAEIKRIIKEHCGQNELRVYLNSLMTHYQSSNSLGGKELIVILYGYIANIYRNRLLDPLDHPPNLMKTVTRIVTHIRNVCLKENSYTIHKACSYSIIELLDLCMDKKNIQKVYDVFLGPFIDLIINSSNKYLRDGCCVYINDFIYQISKKKDNFSMNMFDILIKYNNYVNSVLKLNTYDNNFLYEGIYNLIQFFPFEYFQSDLLNIIHKVINILQHSKNYNHLTIINCLNIIGIIGKRIKLYKINIDVIDSAIETIRSFYNDRVKNVRLAAKEAMKAWDDIQKEKFIEGEDTNEERENFINNMRNKSKSGKVDQYGQYDSEIISKMKKDIYNKGIGDLLKLSKFIKEHSNKTNEQYINFRNVPIKKLVKKDYKKYDLKEHMPIEYRYEEKKKNLFMEDKGIAPTEFENKERFNFAQTEKSEDKEIDKENDNNNCEQKSNSEHKLKLSNVYKLVDLSQISKSFSTMQKSYSNFEKQINTKLYKIENQFEKINNDLINNTKQIYNNHHNILNETEVDEDSKTDINYSKELTISSSNEDAYTTLNQYIKSLSFISDSEIEQAFLNILENGDDIFLLRLMILNIPNIDQLASSLSRETFIKILLRINKINKSFFVEKMLFKMIECVNEAIVNESLMGKVILQDKVFANEILETLSQMSNIKNQNIQNKAKFCYDLILSQYK